MLKNVVLLFVLLFSFSVGADEKQAAGKEEGSIDRVIGVVTTTHTFEMKSDNQGKVTIVSGPTLHHAFKLVKSDQLKVDEKVLEKSAREAINEKMKGHDDAVSLFSFGDFMKGFQKGFTGVMNVAGPIIGKVLPLVL